MKHKWAKEIIHWANGGEIEIKFTSGAGSKSGWMTESNPSWDFDECEYRIKPQPKPDIYLYVYQDCPVLMSLNLKDQYKDKLVGKIKLEQDDE